MDSLQKRAIKEEIAAEGKSGAFEAPRKNYWSNITPFLSPKIIIPAAIVLGAITYITSQIYLNEEKKIDEILNSNIPTALVSIDNFVNQTSFTSPTGMTTIFVPQDTTNYATDAVIGLGDGKYALGTIRIDTPDTMVMLGSDAWKNNSK